MLNVFRKKPKPPTPDEKKKLEYWFDKYLKHLQNAKDLEDALSLSTEDIMSWMGRSQDLTSEIGKNCGAQAIEFASAIECLRNAQAAWPSGKAILADFITSTEYLLKIMNNARDLARFSLSNPSDDALRTKTQAIFRVNREYQKQSNHFREIALTELDGFDLL
jgi:hypothetical protein